MFRRGRWSAAAAAAAALAVGSPPVGPSPAGAAPTGAYFSEYIEGSGNNKALEIANPTDAPFDLGAAGAAVAMYFNGNPSPGLTIELTGTIPPGDVFVLAHGSADPAILAEADQISSASWFNGDDAVVLLQDGTVVDSIGQIGADPGTAWGDAETSTQDRTLRRRAGSGPDADASDAFDPAAQWESFPRNTFDGLGSVGTLPPPGDPGPTDPCTATVTHEIGVVQGEGGQSPLDGQVVTIEGVVVGDFQGGDQLQGVFVQDADGDADGATSDGIFVFAPDAPALTVGDVIRTTGTVEEYFGLTEITDVTTIGDCGDAAVPEPTPLDLPADDAERERLEGMLVSLAEVTATETYDLSRYGELVVSSGGRLFTPTNDGDDDAAQQALNDRRRLVIDDGSTRENPAAIPFTDVDGGVIRLGDSVSGAVGVLSYGFDAYRLQPTRQPVVTRANPRPTSPDPVGGDVTVASFNVLNYFTTLDAGGARTDSGHEPRGANTAGELERQRAKIVEAILELDASVVGLMEIENDVDDAALEDLVAALNAAAGGERYASIEEPDAGGGLFGSDAIKVAMIHQPAEVVPMGAAATTTDAAFDNARLPLAQRFRPARGGQPFTVVVNHFKSKGCADASGPDLDRGDGQGCYNAARVEQAHALLALLDTLDDEDVMIIGDLNAYGDEDPIDVLEAAGYVDLIDTHLREADQYTYVFSGQAGYLDHGLVSPRLARRITGVDIWHINADEARFLDYNQEYNPASAYEPGPYRSSDHDPVLVGVARNHGATGNGATGRVG